MVGVYKWLPPKSKSAPPRSPPNGKMLPPTVGGSRQKSAERNFQQKSPPAPPQMDQSPPHCGGEHPKIDQNRPKVPPTVGGSTSKCSKLAFLVAPPLLPPIATLLPPTVGGSLGGEWLPPAHLECRGVSPQIRCSPLPHTVPE